MWVPGAQNITYVETAKRPSQEDPPFERVEHNSPLKVLCVDVCCGVIRTILDLRPTQPTKQQRVNQEPKDKQHAVATTKETNQRPLSPWEDDDFAMFVRSPPSESQD
jgi:hypothetical protein